MKQYPTRRDFIRTTGAAAVGALALQSGTAGRAPLPAAARAPNILFFFPDQHRFDWTGANPHVSVRTPVLDRVAAQGIRFDRAYCASPLCAPSRACLAAGKEYDRCGVPNNGTDYPIEQTTFYTMLRESGYHVMGCGKFDLHKPSLTWGLDGQHLLDEWGFSAGVDSAGKWDLVRAAADGPADPYSAYLERYGLREVHLKDMHSRRGGNYRNFTAVHPTPLPERAYGDNWIARRGLELIRSAPTGRPWFLQVNFAGPHEPNDITHRMDVAVQARRPDFPPPNRNTQLNAATHVAVRQNYTAMVDNIDAWLGIYLDELERRGELENTLIVFSSDHGEMLGDHDRWSKKVPYEPSVGVPLVLAGPGVRAGQVSNALVSVIDLAATFLEAAGMTVPREMDARSLVPLLSGRTDTHRTFLRSGLDDWRLIRDERYKLILGFDPARSPRKTDGVPAFDDAPVLLYDMEADPLEHVNRSGKMPDRVRRMTEALMSG